MKHLVLSISHHQLNTQQMTIDFITFLHSWLDKWGHQLHIEAYFCTFMDFDMSKDFYSILGVDRTADEKEIKKHFVKLR